MSSWLVNLVVAVALLVGAASASVARDVKVAVEGDYPPFSVTLPDGSLTGFSIEMLRAVCKNRGLNCELIKMEFAGMIPALVSGKVDMVGSLTISEERKRRILFANPTYRSPVYFIGKTGLRVDPANPSTFDGKTIGVESASIMQCYVDQTLPKAKMKLYTGQLEAQQDLKNGRIDMLVAEGIQARAIFLKSNPDFSFISDPVTSKSCFGPGTAIALRQDHTELAEIINEGLKAVRADGTYKAINDKYFDFSLEPRD